VLGALSFFTLLFAYLTWRLPGRAPEPGAAAGLPAAEGQPSVGKPLPDLVLMDHEGRALTFGALRGRPVWLAVFRSVGCDGCRQQLLELGARAAEVAQAGVQLLAVMPDSPEMLGRLRRELALPFPFLSDRDEQATTALCGGVTRCQLLVDPDGIVRWAGASEGDQQNPAPQALLEAARRLGQ
jgi:peroxiredoxin